MTLQQAMRTNLRIEPGRRVRTFGGWCRRDRVLLDGCEIGRIQTRRGKSRTEVMTIGAAGFVPGHDVDWLVSEAETCGVVALRRGALGAAYNRAPARLPLELLKRSAG
ncbi:MAG TPA: hypothetical protein VNS63_17005 [Blastocatellia bacterium]|nr:hypothetical protein [Blastocatellia bacterium]